MPDGSPRRTKRSRNPRHVARVPTIDTMTKLLLWLLLLVFCWPLALLALILYPVVWLVLLPFRLVGIAVDGVLQLLRSILLLPARVLRGPRAA
jgi:hypothetical protein